MINEHSGGCFWFEGAMDHALKCCLIWIYQEEFLCPDI